MGGNRGSRRKTREKAEKLDRRMREFKEGKRVIDRNWRTGRRRWTQRRCLSYKRKLRGLELRGIAIILGDCSIWDRMGNERILDCVRKLDLSQLCFSLNFYFLMFLRNFLLCFPY